MENSTSKMFQEWFTQSLKRQTAVENKVESEVEKLNVKRDALQNVVHDLSMTVKLMIQSNVNQDKDIQCLKDEVSEIKKDMVEQKIKDAKTASNVESNTEHVRWSEKNKNTIIISIITGVLMAFLGAFIGGLFPK